MSAAQLFFGLAFRRRAADESSRYALPVRLQHPLQALPLFVGRDLSRHADMFHGRHVNHKAARQRDVRSDARALLSQRFLGDLNDDLLAFLEQVGNGRQRRALPFVVVRRPPDRFVHRLRTASGRRSPRSRAATVVPASSSAFRRGACAGATTAAFVLPSVWLPLPCCPRLPGSSLPCRRPTRRAFCAASGAIPDEDTGAPVRAVRRSGWWGCGPAQVLLFGMRLPRRSVPPVLVAALPLGIHPAPDFQSSVPQLQSRETFSPGPSELVRVRPSLPQRRVRFRYVVAAAGSGSTAPLDWLSRGCFAAGFRRGSPEQVSHPTPG